MMSKCLPMQMAELLPPSTPRTGSADAGGASGCLIIEDGVGIWTPEGLGAFQGKRWLIPHSKILGK